LTGADTQMHTKCVLYNTEYSQCSLFDDADFVADVQLINAHITAK